MGAFPSRVGFRTLHANPGPRAEAAGRTNSKRTNDLDSANARKCRCRCGLINTSEGRGPWFEANLGKGNEAVAQARSDVLDTYPCTHVSGRVCIAAGIPDSGCRLEARDLDLFG